MEKAQGLRGPARRTGMALPRERRVMRVKEFYQWLIDLADATDNAPIDLPSAEHAFLTGRTVAQYLESKHENSV